MAISRSQLTKELEPGLNALFGLEYDKYDKEHLQIFDVESSDRAFEEEVMLAGFGNAETKPEGSGVNYDTAFAITEEAIEDNLYDKLAGRYTKALARSMANTKQIKAANVLNNGFSSSYTGGDGKELLATDHPTVSGGDMRNELSTAADLNETSLEQALVDLADMIDERGLKVAVQATKMIVPSELVFVAERLLQSQLRVGTADNDVNAVKSSGMIPGGYVVNHYLTDSDAWFLKTDAPNGLKVFERSPLKTSMEGDFDTGNVRYKARERYSFGWSDPRGIFGSPGA